MTLSFCLKKLNLQKHWFIPRILHMKKRRRHIQIALVGGQPTPVYQGIIHLKPDQIVLICSSTSHEVADGIKSQLPSYADKDVLIYEISDLSIEEMTHQIEQIESLLPKGITLSLNVSSGMKLWSIFFTNIFKRKRRSCHTFFIGQNGTFFDLKEKTSGEKVNFDMEAQFKILGHTMDSYTPFADYTPEDFAVMDQCMAWGLSESMHEPFFKLSQFFVDNYKKIHKNNDYTNPFYSFIPNTNYKLDWNPSTHTFTLTHEDEVQELTSPHAANIVLNTGWFELYVAKFISMIYPTDQIRLNCVFKNKRHNVKNEVDIIVNTGNKLIFVECKTQVYKAIDVDKFRSVVHNYGGLGSKHLFVTCWKMQPEAKEKCKDHGITTFYFQNGEYHNDQDKAKALAAVLDKLNKTWNFK